MGDPMMCPVGTPFCPTIRIMHAVYFLMFNGMKGTWVPKDEKPTWMLTDMTFMKIVNGPPSLLEVESHVNKHPNHDSRAVERGADGDAAEDVNKHPTHRDAQSRGAPASDERFMASPLNSSPSLSSSLSSSSPEDELYRLDANGDLDADVDDENDPSAHRQEMLKRNIAMHAGRFPPHHGHERPNTTGTDSNGNPLPHHPDFTSPAHHPGMRHRDAFVDVFRPLAKAYGVDESELEATVLNSLVSVEWKPVNDSRAYDVDWDQFAREVIALVPGWSHLAHLTGGSGSGSDDESEVPVADAEEWRGGEGAVGGPRGAAPSPSSRWQQQQPQQQQGGLLPGEFHVERPQRKPVDYTNGYRPSVGRQPEHSHQPPQFHFPAPFVSPTPATSSDSSMRGAHSGSSPVSYNWMKAIWRLLRLQSEEDEAQAAAAGGPDNRTASSSTAFDAAGMQEDSSSSNRPHDEHPFDWAPPSVQHIVNDHLQDPFFARLHDELTRIVSRLPREEFHLPGVPDPIPLPLEQPRTADADGVADGEKEGAEQLNGVGPGWRVDDVAAFTSAGSDAASEAASRDHADSATLLEITSSRGRGRLTTTAHSAKSHGQAVLSAGSRAGLGAAAGAGVVAGAPVPPGVDASRPDPFPDIYPNLYFPPGSPGGASRETMRTINRIVKQRDSAMDVFSGSGSGAGRGNGGGKPAFEAPKQRAAHDPFKLPRQPSIPPSKDDGGGNGGGGGLPGLPGMPDFSLPKFDFAFPANWKAGDHALVAQLPFMALLGIKPLEGWIIKENHVIPGDNDSPVICYDLKLRNGLLMPCMIAPLLTRPSPTLPAIPMPPSTGFVPPPPVVIPVWPGIPNPAVIAAVTMKIFNGATVQDGPWPIAIQMDGILAAAWLAAMPPDIMFQAYGGMCDCLCPIPGNRRLPAPDCGSLANRISTEARVQAAFNAAVNDASEAASRTNSYAVLAKGAAKLAKLPPLPFPKA